MLSKLKCFLKQNDAFILLYNYFSGNSIKGKRSNYINNKGCRFKNLKINIIGKSNTINFGKNSYVQNCNINVYGDHNTICIGENVITNTCNFWCEDANNLITIGANTTINGKTDLACIEGTSIKIGEDCMFSSEIAIRTGDSHSILDKTGKRINPSKDIIIGNHVWIGTKTVFLKGVSIEDNSIVGAGALVTKKFDEQGVIIAGNPAKIIKRSINWSRERLKIS